MQEVNIFDNNGRVATRTYPNGLVLKYVYTTLGYLSQIRNNATNVLYWSAGSMDAEGRLLQQTYGNNILTQQVFEASTGRLKNIYAGAGNSVQNLSYSYDNIGGLQSRNDGNQSLSETFLYDSLNRLTSSTVNSGGAGLVTQTYAYDNIGNMTSRSGVGTYTYGAVNSRPHGVTSIAWTGGGQRQYTYDANGNLTGEVQRDASNNVIAAKGRTETYTSFNMPKTIVTPTSSLTFVYDSEHQRSKQIAANVTTIYLNPDNNGGLLYEKDVKSNGIIEHRNFITAGGQVIAVAKQSGVTTTISYLHRDNMGSTSAVTDEAGSVIERLAYEPFGKRRFSYGSLDTNNTVVGVNTNRGYTNHEHLDTVGLIHMNGRVYDPVIGRFMTADPIIQAADNLQSYNRYAYVMNNPFMYTDPSGFSAWTNFRDKFAKPVAIMAASYFTAGWAAGAYSSSAIQAVSIAVPGTTLTTITSAQLASITATSHIVGGAVGGFAGGFLGSGGDLKAGLIGGITGAGFGWAGNIGGTGTLGANSLERYAAHALVGCASGEMSGGGCGVGAFSAVAGKFASNQTAGLDNISSGIAATVAGGTISVIGGGKFENGAMTAAFGYLFNQMASKNPVTVQAGISGQIGAWVIGGAAELGIAIPSTRDDICVYAQACGVGGPQFVAAGGLSTSIGLGLPTSGLSSAQGLTWFGGNGAFGSGQLTVNQDSQAQIGRGVARFGVGVGAGAGYIQCRQATACLRR